MKSCILFIFTLIIFSVSIATAEDYFPKGTFDDFTITWYSRQLKALDEPPIYNQKSDVKKQCYRFIWLRTFHHPISIRTEINGQDQGFLYVKETDGAGGYDPGKIKTDDKKSLSQTEVERFLEIISKNNFWSLPKTEESNGLDGAQWIIEGLSKGKYHVVERWSPESGNVKEIGLLLLKLSGLKVNEKEIY